MADLQAEIEVTIELGKFCNIDLFVQGYYQVRTAIKCNPKIQSTSKIEIKSECPFPFDDSNERIYPASTLNEWGVSKTFLIVYKNEEVQLDDQFNFKLSVIVDAQNITECFSRMDMQLFIELYFMEKEYSIEKIATMQQLCSRCYKLHFNPRLGIHTHVPIVFDYFHLSAVTATVHASLLCLIPPYVFDRPNTRRTSLFSFLFGQDLSQITTDQVKPTLLDRAYQLHNLICEMLLSAYESLQDFYEKMVDQLPADRAKPVYAHQNCRPKLKSLCDKLRIIDDIHNIDNLAHAHIAQCSAENIMLWGQFMQVFGLHESTSIFLAKEYHLKRVKRFSEGFFLRELSRINLLTNESDLSTDLHDLVRNSAYYSRLPHLPIECIEIDGQPDTLPILVEEVYSAVEEKTTVSANAAQILPKFDKTPQTTVVTTDDTSNNSTNKEKKQNPNSTDKSNSSSPASTSSKDASSSLNLISKFQSINRGIGSSRSMTTKGVNPIVASATDTTVQLTSFRKFDEDNPEKLVSSSPSQTSPSTLQSSSMPSSTLFSYSSDSNINRTTKRRSHSLKLWKKLSSNSLPDVPYDQRDVRKGNRTPDSANIPKFLSPTSNRVDDEVFSSPEQEGSSTFVDSSMKSKVLQASFRGKTGTMDRRTVSSSSRSLSSSSPMATGQGNRSEIQSNRHFVTRTSVNENESNMSSAGNALDSVLQLTSQFEQTATENIQRRHTISIDDVNPLLLNGLTDDENHLHFIEKNSENLTPNGLNNNSTMLAQADQEKSSTGSDRIQQNTSINSQTIEFVVHKEKLKQILQSKYTANLMFYSDLSNPITLNPYFLPELVPLDTNGAHLIVCVHGLDGNSGDLRLVKTYLELCLPSCQLEFLMSSANHSSTFDDIDIMVKQLINEIDTHVERYSLKPQRISFIGHSLGNLIIRAAVGHQRFERYRPALYTYLSLSGPHLGTLFNTSGLVNMGMWLMQKWKNSCSLSQMSLKDHVDPKQTYLYNLSKKPSLEFFKNILLIASPQDRYVPYHSARIEVCKAALKDTAYGSIYVEMISNLLEPILRNPSINFVRYNTFHSIPTGTNNLIGRAAHIAILDSELFVEKFILVSAAKYFK